MQGRCKGGPSRVVPQTLEHDFEPVIGAIDARDGLSRRGPQCPQSLGYPGFNMHHPVVTTGHHGTEPDRAHPAQAEPLPVAVGGEMVVSQRRETHPLHLLKQRSEEHTSELQSQSNLVCRLLLEKKKNKTHHLTSVSNHVPHLPL